MPKFSGVDHLDAVRAFERAGFHVARQSGHIVMTDGSRSWSFRATIACIRSLLGNIIRDAGLTNDEFRKLL